MGMEKRRSRARRGARIAVPLAVAVAGSTLAACSTGPGGTVVNLYGGAAAQGFDKIIAECNKAADGKYTIVGNLLPSDADSQREQLVRRLAANDKGMDLIGMDVTWTAEFAEAKWIRALTDAQLSAAKLMLQQPSASVTTVAKAFKVNRSTLYRAMAEANRS